MKRMVLKTPAKINLALDVVGKRADGYHTLETIFQTVSLYDTITVTLFPHRTGEQAIRILCNIPWIPKDERNIAWKAVDLFLKKTGCPVGFDIYLQKYIPSQAGLGGGSSDAAAVLYACNQLTGAGLSHAELCEMGLQLGADVPYCLMRRTALSEGIGEILTPVAPLPDCPILIAKPSISVSTRYVYEHLKLNEETLHPDVDGIVSALKAKELYGVTDRLGNVLETVTIPEHPVIADIKQQMMQSGAVNALMSGSGPTVFGIFDDEDKAKKAFEDMKASGLARQIYLTRPFNQKIKSTRKNQRKR